MLTFLDGPAAGKADHLLIRRAPTFLRVIVTPDGKWDALDQVIDTPLPDETIYAYHLVGGLGSVHLDYTDSKTGRRCGETYMSADYRLVDPQPDDVTVRDNMLWRAWATDALAKAKGVATADILPPAPPGKPGVCRSCGRAILWLDTPVGAIMPLDAETDGGGNVVVVDGKAVVLKGSLFDERPVDGVRYKSHFATCDRPELWRNK